MQSTLISVGCNRLHKRDGNLVAFDADKIRQALIAAGKATGEYTEVEAEACLRPYWPGWKDCPAARRANPGPG